MSPREYPVPLTQLSRHPWIPPPARLPAHLRDPHLFPDLLLRTLSPQRQTLPRLLPQHPIPILLQQHPSLQILPFPQGLLRLLILLFQQGLLRLQILLFPQGLLRLLILLFQQELLRLQMLPFPQGLLRLQILPFPQGPLRLQMLPFPQRLPQFPGLLFRLRPPQLPGLLFPQGLPPHQIPPPLRRLQQLQIPPPFAPPYRNPTISGPFPELPHRYFQRLLPALLPPLRNPPLLRSAIQHTSCSPHRAQRPHPPVFRLLPLSKSSSLQIQKLTALHPLTPGQAGRPPQTLRPERSLSVPLLFPSCRPDYRPTGHKKHPRSRPGSPYM